MWMKLNKGTKVVAYLLSLLNVFMLLERSGPYRSGATAGALVMIHQATQLTKAAKLVAVDLSLINEEAGEISFSVAARMMLANTNKADVVQADKVFKMSSKCLETVKMFEGDDEKGVDSHYKIQADGEEVGVVTHYFRQILREMKANRWKHYSKNCVKKVDEARAKLVLEDVVPFGRVKSVRELEDVIKKTEKEIVGYWAQDKNVVAEFPEAMHGVGGAVAQDGVVLLDGGMSDDGGGGGDDGEEENEENVIGGEGDGDDVEVENVDGDGEVVDDGGDEKEEDDDEEKSVNASGPRKRKRGEIKGVVSDDDGEDDWFGDEEEVEVEEVDSEDDADELRQSDDEEEEEKRQADMGNWGVGRDSQSVVVNGRTLRNSRVRDPGFFLAQEVQGFQDF